MKLIQRTLYLDRLLRVMGTPDIKVITGVRRSGKSKLLEAFMDEVRARKPEANIIHINFNQPEFEKLTEYRALYDFVTACYVAGKENLVLIDEVQMCQGFEKAMNWLHASEKYDLYITGSNAFLLSSDLATLFTGRTFEIPVYPFSLAEFMQYFDLTDPSSAFERYLLEGGLAGSYLYGSQEAKYRYIAEVFSTLIVRDIKQKYRIRYVHLLERIVHFMMDNVANLTNAHGIAAALTAARDKINHKTVGAYMQYLCNAFAFYKVRRFDIRGKKYLVSSEKYYLSDHAFRYAVLGTRNMDFGRVMENMVAVELLRRGYELYAGVLYQKEVDFVALKRDEKIYIQVSDNIADPATLTREVTSLLQIKDAYPKLLLARTRHPAYQYEGIQIMDIAEWLMR